MGTPQGAFFRADRGAEIYVVECPDAPVGPPRCACGCEFVPAAPGEAHPAAD